MHLLLNNSKYRTIVNRRRIRRRNCARKECLMKFKVIVTIIVAATIAVMSACIASSATKKNLDPEQVKVWIESNIVYLEYPDGNVWAHEVE